MNGAASTQTMHASSSTKPTDEYWQDDFRPLSDAGKGIRSMLRRDEMSTHGDLYRRIISNTPSGSNAHNININGGDAETNPAHHYFYPTAPNTGSSMASSDNGKKHVVDSKESTIQHLGTIPLPPELEEKRKKVKMSTMMGLFPQGRLAWLTIDDTVHMWSYNSSLDGTSDGTAEAGDSGQVMQYQMPTKQSIISVGLAKPKPGQFCCLILCLSFEFFFLCECSDILHILPYLTAGVFKDTVAWCLVLTTKEEAALCVLNRTTTAFGAPMTVVPTKFTVPSDWVSFLCVGSTKSGRIFLGGQDGNLYELDYDMASRELPFFGYGNRRHNAVEQQLNRFYDGTDDIADGPTASTTCPDVIVDKSLPAFQSSTERLLATGKRVLDAALPSSIHHVMGDYHSFSRPRKCRKLNHSNDSVFRHVLPNFITQVGSYVFGDSSSSAGGAITQIAVDDERQLVYTLSSPKGWICVFDMKPSSTMYSTASSGQESKTPTIPLAAVLDMPSAAQSYLESVSRGRLSPASSHTFREGGLCFLGNAAAAQAGVGGMEGARRILRQVESGKATLRRSRKKAEKGVNILTPVSLQIVPCRESTRITLVAITSGGLRYYLSTLDPRSIGGGPPKSRSKQNPWKPTSRRMTLYHIRATPPLLQDGATADRNGRAPSVLENVLVDASCYRLGTFVIALEATSRSATSNNDMMVAATMDSTKRITIERQKDGKSTNSYVSPGGICEQLSMNLSSASGISGGRIWSIEPASLDQSRIMSLALHSKTPSDSELNYVVPPFIPLPKPKRPSPMASKSGSGSIVSTAKFGSVGVGVMMNVLLGRPTSYGISLQEPIIQPLGVKSTYRISTHSGSDGFSMSAADILQNQKSGSGARSARLNTWLLHPEAVSLAPAALNHLQPLESTFLAMNVGGIHSYKSISTLGRLRNAILKAGTNTGTDPVVGQYFQDYGLAECCAMCFMLIVSPTSSLDLKKWSLQAALRHTDQPSLLALDDSEAADLQQAGKSDPWIPAGFVLKPSRLVDGLFMAASRLLRPIWFKPAVVVTEGKLVKRGLKSSTTEAKVELLLDDDATSKIAQGLLDLSDAIALFRISVDSVPAKGAKHAMFLNAADAVELARHIEERNIHSLYRLLCRTTQLLSLLHHLRLADSMDGIPEVEWGLLHGLQFAQLVETSLGQERVESVLNKLVTSPKKAFKLPSADANRLADILSQNCYYFFSSGNRNAFLGFQAAQEALAMNEGHSRRAVKTVEAAGHLLKASKYWFSPMLVTGQLLQTRDSEGFVEVAERAIRHNSPLAKACSCLVELGDISSVVHICLATAGNFSLNQKPLAVRTDLSRPEGVRPWEVGLYHQRTSIQSEGTNISPGRPTPMGTNVTPKEAVNACYSLVFYYLSKFLESPTSSESYRSGEEMVSVCAFQSDKSFLREFFEMMLKENQKDVLLRLSSDDLESWLVGKQKEHPDLLLNYFQIQKKCFQAGELARSLACEEQAQMTISDRIEYLEISVSSFSEALVVGETPSNHASIEQFKKETESILNIAKLQFRTLQAIESTMYEVSDELLKRLEFSLLGASDLLNSFAWPFGMYEICLLVFMECNFDDAVQTEVFWKSLMCTSFLPCVTRNLVVFQKLENFVSSSDIEQPNIALLDATEPNGDPEFEMGDWRQKLEDSVVRLGQEIVGRGAGFVFPVEFIASCLEGECLRVLFVSIMLECSPALNFKKILFPSPLPELRTLFVLASPSYDVSMRPDWTFHILLSAGVPFKTSFDGVYRVLKTDGLVAVGRTRTLENMEIAVSMLESFVEGVQAHRSGYARVGYMDLKVAIDEVRVDLQAIPENVDLLEGRLYYVEQTYISIAQS
ncbi:MAG: hypothetical protein SGILL_001994 [Bacillariaceae sp.]